MGRYLILSLLLTTGILGTLSQRDGVDFVGNCDVNAAKPLGFHDDNHGYPPITSSDITVAGTIMAPDQPAFIKRLKLSNRDTGDCLDAGSLYWQVEFKEARNVYSVQIQGTSYGSLTNADVKLLQEDGTWKEITGTPFTLAHTDSIHEILVSTDASAPTIKSKKVRIYPTAPAQPEHQCARLDVQECTEDVMLAQKCATGHQSVGLTRSSHKVHELEKKKEEEEKEEKRKKAEEEAKKNGLPPPEYDDEKKDKEEEPDVKVSSPDMDHYTMKKAALDLHAHGACLYGGATHFEVEFEKNEPVYKFVFQGTTESNAKQVKVEYHVDGSDVMKNDHGLENPIDMTLTTYGQHEFTLTAITEMKGIKVYILDAEPAANPKCLSMGVITCPVGTDLALCGPLEKDVHPEKVEVVDAKQSDEFHWDEEANAHRFEWRDYRGGCISETDEITISFNGNIVSLPAIVVQGATGGVPAAGTAGQITGLKVIKTDLNGAETEDMIPVSLSSPVASQIIALTEAQSVTAVKIQATNWDGKGAANTKTCFRFELLGCYGCRGYLGMDANKPIKIHDNQLSDGQATVRADIGASRLNSPNDFCLETAGDVLVVNFMTTVTVNGFIFGPVTSDGVDAQTTIEYKSLAVADWTDVGVTPPAVDITKDTEVTAGSPLDVRELRFKSTKKVCLHIEIFGCRGPGSKYQCAYMPHHPLGLLAGEATFPLDHITTNSGTHPPASIRLDDKTPDPVDVAKMAGFCQVPTNNEYIELDFDGWVDISAVRFQQAGVTGEEVTKYEVHYLDKNEEFVLKGEYKITWAANAALDDVQEKTGLDLHTMKIRIKPIEPAAKACFRLGLTGCRPAMYPKAELLLKAKFVSDAGGDISDPDKCLDHYLESFPKDDLEHEIQDAVHAIGRSEIDFKVGKYFSEPDILNFKLEIGIKAGAHFGAATNAAYMAVQNSALFAAAFGADAHCGAIKKESRFMTVKAEFDCMSDQQLLRGGDSTHSWWVCVKPDHFKCARPSTFADVPTQVAGYAASFERNMLYQDMVVDVADAADCLAKAVHFHYPSYYTDTTNPSQAKCFLTHVYVNDDYYFTDQNLMEKPPAKAIKQRQCYFDYSKIPYLHHSQSLIYKKAGFDPCFGETLDEAAKHELKSELELKYRQATENVIGQCMEAGAVMWMSGLSLELTFTIDPATNLGAVDLTMKLTATIKAMDMFASKSAITTCGTAFQSAMDGLKNDDIVIGYDCGGNAQEKLQTADITGGDWNINPMVWSCNEDPEKPITGDEFYLGPQDLMCYSKEYEGFEAMEGFCPMPSGCATIEESINACARKCLRDDTCFGFNWEIKKKFCHFATAPCEEVFENADILYFKRTDGLCKTLMDTEIKCLIEYGQEMQKVLMHDRQAEYHICKESYFEKVESCYEKVKATCDKETFAKFEWVGYTLEEYTKTVCYDYNVLHYVPSGGCDVHALLGELHLKYEALVKAFVLTDNIKPLCDAYAVDVRDWLNDGITTKNCNEMEAFLTIIQLEYLHNHYLILCTPERTGPIPNNGDRSDEYCSPEAYWDCLKEYEKFWSEKLYGDGDFTVAAMCESMRENGVCALEQLESCDDTDKMIGPLHKTVIEHGMSAFCTPEIEACGDTDNVLDFAKAIHQISLHILRGEHKDDKVLCDETEWGNFKAKVEAALDVTTSDCTADNIDRLKAAIVKVDTYRATYCAGEPAEEIKEGDECHVEEARKCALGVTKAFVGGWTVGIGAHEATCEMYFGAVSCVMRHLQKCSGPTMQRYLSLLDFYYADFVDGANCVTTPIDDRCQPAKDMFDGIYNEHKTIVENMAKTMNERCTALNDMRTKLWDYSVVDISSCPVYDRLQRLTAVRQLEFNIAPYCSECGSSESVTCLISSFTSMVGTKKTAKATCTDTVKSHLKECVETVADHCKEEELERVSKLAKLTHGTHESMCGLLEMWSDKPYFCVVPEWKCKSVVAAIETEVDVTGVMECRHKCEKDSTCHAFHYKQLKCTTMRETCSFNNMIADAEGFFYYKDNYYNRCKAPARFCHVAGKMCTGHDIDQSVHPSIDTLYLEDVSEEECETACRYDENCKSIEYQLTNGKKCWLKDHVCSDAELADNPTNNPTIGIKMHDYEYCVEGPPMKKFCKHANKKCGAEDLSPFTSGKSMQQCMDACHQDANCVGIQYEVRDDAIINEDKDKHHWPNPGKHANNEKNRCTLKKAKCTDAELEDEKWTNYLDIIDNDAECMPEVYKKWTCDTIEADKCISHAIGKLFRYSAIKNPFYHILLCHSYKATEECVMKHIKDCNTQQMLQYKNALSAIHYGLGYVCEDFHKPNDRCHTKEAKERLHDMNKDLLKFWAKDKDWNLVEQCGKTKKAVKHIKDDVEHCDKDYIGYKLVQGTADKAYWGTDMFCMTLIAGAGGCKESHAFKCVKDFSVAVTDVIISKNSRLENYCSVYDLQALSTCLVEGLIVCPNSAEYFQGIVEHYQKALGAWCHRPACRAVNVADLVFIVDESGSVKEDNFFKQVHFLKDVAESLGREHIHEDGVRVAIYEFSNKVNEKLELKKSGDYDGLLRYIDNMKYKKGATKTYDAFKLVEKDLKKYGREGVPQVVVILTDGKSKSKSKTLKEAGDVKDLGAKVIVVGIGSNLDLAEIVGMASQPEADYVYYKDFDGLQDFIPTLIETIYCSGVGGVNMFEVTDGNQCDATGAKQCIDNWDDEFFTLLGTAETKEEFRPVCMKITETTKCLETATKECSWPTIYRFAGGLWQLRDAMYAVCHEIVTDTPEWGHYGPSCGDDTFDVMKKCVDDLDKKIGRTRPDKYKDICGDMKKAVACIANGASGCPALEQFYWRAKVFFTAYPIISAGGCDSPNPNPPNTGAFCDKSEAVEKIGHFTVMTAAANIHGDFKDVCEYNMKHKHVMTADMAQCVNKQNNMNREAYFTVAKIVEPNCCAPPEPKEADAGCNFEEMNKCSVDFGLKWNGEGDTEGWKVGVLAGDAAVKAEACGEAALTLDCISSHTTTCGAQEQIRVAGAVALFKATWSAILVCEEVVISPAQNENCLLDQANAAYEALFDASEIGDGSGACALRKATNARIDANTIDCPNEELAVIQGKYNTLSKALDTICAGQTECKTDKTRVVLDAGEYANIDFWFEGNPYRSKKCEGVSNCEIKVRYALQTIKNKEHKCKKRDEDIFQPHGVFAHKANEPECGIDITEQNYADKHVITLNARFFRKKGKDQKRRLEIFCQVYEDGEFLKEEVCTQLEVLFKRDTEIQKSAISKSCIAWGDPHFVTFAGIKFNNYFTNFFTLVTYKNQVKYPIAVQGYFSKCNPAWPYACLTLVSIKAGGVVVTLDRVPRGDGKRKTCRKNCEKDKNKKGSSSTAIEVTKRGDMLDGFHVYYIQKKKTFVVQFGHGTYMRFEEIQGAFDFALYPTPQDFQEIEGLCGALEMGDANDMKFPDGSFYDTKLLRNNDARPTPFNEAWMVAEGSILQRGQFTAWRKSGPTKTYCSCSVNREAAHKCGDFQATDGCYKLMDKGKKMVQDLTEDLIDLAVDLDLEPQQQQQRRKKRAINPDPLPVNSQPPAPATWPLADGTTEDQAIAFCESQRDAKPEFALCAAAPYNVDIQGFVDTCVMDIKLGVDKQTAADMSLNKALVQCVDVLSASGDPNAAALLNQVEDILCPNNCNGNGNCVSGACVCTAPYDGADCSVDTSQPPDVVAIGANGECDPRSTSCINILVTADNINENIVPVCRLQELQVTATTASTVGAAYTVNATIVSASQITCPTNKPAHHEISVSNNGANFSPTYLQLVFDPTCITCDTSGINPTCTQTTTSCLIGGVCYAQGAMLPGDDCLVCDIAYSTTAFKVKKTQVCYQTHGMSFGNQGGLDQTDLIIIGCVVALVIIGILAFVIFKFCVKTPAKAAANGSDSSPIHRSRPDARYTFDGPDNTV